MAQVSVWRDDGTLSFAARLAHSETFKTLFRDGMALVEETAGYLDGDGRSDSKGLPRTLALAYAAESMRLTTRLMQLASWLLLQRAVNEGEMTQSEAASEKRKVRLTHQDAASHPDTMVKLPAPLVALVEKSMRLQERVIHLDEMIYNQGAAAAPAPAARPLEDQLELLRAAFSPR